MSDIRTVKTTTIDIDSDVAADYLAKNYIGQRTLKIEHARFLREEMRAGRFTLNTIIIGVDRNGAQHLMNGQHTLSAVLNTNIVLEGQPLVIVDVGENANNGADPLANLYGTTDYGRGRQVYDGLRPLGTAKNTGLDEPELNRLIRAIRFFLAGWPRGGIKHKIAAVKLHELAINWAPYYTEYKEITAGGHEVVTGRMGVMGPLSVFLPLLRYADNPSEVQQFITHVALGDTKTRTPGKALNIFLVETKYRRPSAPTQAGYGGPVSLALGVGHAWNKHARGTTLKTISASTVSGGRKISIEGTNFVIDSTQPRGQTIAHDLWYQLTGLKRPSEESPNE